MTFIEAINAVLRRLREDAVVSSNSTEYSILIGDFVNQAIYDIEHAYDWSFLKQELQIITVAGTHNYDLPLTDATIITLYNNTKEWCLYQITPEQYHVQFYNARQSGSPTEYAIYNQISSVPAILLHPVPTSSEELLAIIDSHSTAKEIDGSDDSDVLLPYAHPVVLRAYAFAVSERGEDGGIGYAEADQAAQTALADAISLDSTKHTIYELSWQAV